MVTDYQQQMFAKESVWETAQGKHGEQERAQIIQDLLPTEINYVLDAGCGSGVVTNLLNAKVVVGLDRSRTALMHVQAVKLESDLTALPFAYQQFEATTCSEVLEHIPYPLFDTVLLEIARVTSSYIVVSVPWKQAIEKAQVQCPACKCCFQPHYHMRSFHKREMEILFHEHGFRIHRLTTAGHKKPAIGLNRLLKWLNLQQFPSFTVCPQCGYQNHKVIAQVNSTNEKPANLPTFSRTRDASAKKKLARIVRHYWPRRKEQPRWWVALYEREKLDVSSRL